MKANKVYKVFNRKTNAFVIYFLDGCGVSGYGDAIIHNGKSFDDPFTAKHWLVHEVISQMEYGYAINLNDYEVIEYTLAPTNTYKIGSYVEEFLTNEHNDFAERIHILSTMLKLSVTNGFNVFDASYLDKIMNNPKYLSTLKEFVPNLMISNYNEYIERGICDLTADELSAIIMLCTDDIDKMYGISAILKTAIEKENNSK